jgi:hypothetical protein
VDLSLIIDSCFLTFSIAGHKSNECQNEKVEDNRGGYGGYNGGGNYNSNGTNGGGDSSFGAVTAEGDWASGTADTSNTFGAVEATGDW